MGRRSQRRHGPASPRTGRRTRKPTAATGELRGPGSARSSSLSPVDLVQRLVTQVAQPDRKEPGRETPRRRGRRTRCPSRPGWPRCERSAAVPVPSSGRAAPSVRDRSHCPLGRSSGPPATTTRRKNGASTVLRGTRSARRRTGSGRPPRARRADGLGTHPPPTCTRKNTSQMCGPDSGRAATSASPGCSAHHRGVDLDGQSGVDEPADRRAASKWRGIPGCRRGSPRRRRRGASTRP